MTNGPVFSYQPGPGRSRRYSRSLRVRDKSEHWIIRMPKLSHACKHKSREGLSIDHETAPFCVVVGGGLRSDNFVERLTLFL